MIEKSLNKIHDNPTGHPFVRIGSNGHVINDGYWLAYDSYGLVFFTKIFYKNPYKRIL